MAPKHKSRKAGNSDMPKRRASFEWKGTVYMYRENYTYRAQYYSWCQASTEDLGLYPLQITRNCCRAFEDVISEDEVILD